MTFREKTSGVILALLCSVAFSAPVMAQDTGDGTEVTDPVNTDGIGDGQELGGDEGTVDPTVQNDGDGTVEPGVPYGPEDCIDCNSAPTVMNMDGGGRPVGENFRGNVDPTTGSVARGESSNDEICDITKMGDAAKVCP
jgi:hypothetical protein